jgi:hypothetical protein
MQYGCGLCNNKHRIILCMIIIFEQKIFEKLPFEELAIRAADFEQFVFEQLHSSNLPSNQRMFSSNFWKKTFDAVKNTDNSRNVIQRERWMLDICRSPIEDRPHDATHYQPSSVGGCS